MKITPFSIALKYRTNTQVTLITLCVKVDILITLYNNYLYNIIFISNVSYSDVGGRQICTFIFSRSGFNHLHGDSKWVAPFISFLYFLCYFCFSFLFLQLQIFKQLYLLRFENMLKIFFSLWEYLQSCLLFHTKAFTYKEIYFDSIMRKQETSFHYLTLSHSASFPVASDHSLTPNSGQIDKKVNKKDTVWKQQPNKH